MKLNRLLSAFGSAVVLSLAAGGCATDEEYWETADFGDSVRHTIALQTEAPGAPGVGLDARKAQAALDAYREDVAQPKEAEEEIVFRVAD
jgi:hypothetical protein